MFTCTTLIVAISWLPAAAATPNAEAPPPVPLVDIVPVDTSATWHKTSTAESVLAEEHAFAVVDAIVGARFDEFLFETLDHLGTPPELMAELRGFRNVVMTVGGNVRWRDLFEHEVLFSEAVVPAFGSDVDVPSMLLAARPHPAAYERLERSLAALLGALAMASPIHARYDIHVEPGPYGDAKIHTLRIPAFDDLAVLQLASLDGTLLLGLGERYFDDALALLRGGDGPRLSLSPRYMTAFRGLPDDAPCTRYVDVRERLADLEAVTAMFADSSFNKGTWQRNVNEAFGLLEHVETVATVARCRGEQVVLESVTRFDPATVHTAPLARAGIAAPASPALLDYVPADAIAFDMRGDVDLTPLFRQTVEGMRAEGPTTAGLLTFAEMLGAAADFSIERDLLSWIGRECVQITLPSRTVRQPPGQTDTVIIWQLDDPAGARTCLSRLEGVLTIAGGKLVELAQEQLAEAGADVTFDARLVRGQGLYPMLNQIEIQLDGLPMPMPVPIPTITYGLLGPNLVFATSEAALESCLMAAVYEEPGLDARAITASLVGREDLSSARLQPLGDAVRDLGEGLAMVRAMTMPMIAGATAGTEAAWISDTLADFFSRVDDVLVACDVLGDAVTYGERRDDDLAHYECTVIELQPREVPQLRMRPAEPTPEPALVDPLAAGR